MDTQERREKPRAEVDVACVVRRADGTELTVRLLDLTCLGGGFIHTEALPLRSMLQLRFSLPAGQRWHEFTVAAEVIHNYPAIVIAGQQRMTGYVVGVDFATLKAADTVMLCGYIETLLRDGSDAQL